MVRPVYLKTVALTIKSKFVRFLVNVLIVMLSLAIASVLGVLPYSFKDSYLVNFYNYETPDIIMKVDGKNSTKIDEETVDRIQGLEQVDKTYAFFTMDVLNRGKYERLYFMDLYKNEIATPKIIAGRLPKNYKEILINKNVDNNANYKIGEKIIFDEYLFDLNQKNKEFTIVGIVDNPLYCTTHPEIAMNEKAETENPDYLDSIFYISLETVPGIIASQLPNTDLYITMKNKPNYMTSEYDNRSAEFGKLISDTCGANYRYLSLAQNYSYTSFYVFNKNINTISVIFPLLFVIVCALVVYLITTRLIADERSMIACEYSLGASKKRIISKYLCFSFISTTIGVLLGYFLGLNVIPGIFYRSYSLIYDMNGMPNIIYSPMGIILGAVMIVVSFLVTYISVANLLKETPASLMQPKAPKAGKKIWLEHIGFIWKRLSFSLKSSMRNIFRNKKNLILTSLSVIGSIILILIGFGLNDTTARMVNDPTYKNVAGSIGLISTVIILFGLAMSILVIYALASMNIDDRVREIAVLKVLGYRNTESAMYACRELFFITVVAAIIGLPIATLIIALIFSSLKFARIEDVKWYSYVASYVITVSSSIISSLMLYPKIKKIDFNISLKSVE